MRALAIGLLSAATLLASPAFADDAVCIAASESSLQLRQQGKLHESLRQLAACADASCPGEIRAECARRIDAVNAAMPTLILAARDGAGNDLSDVKVSMDGAPLVTTLDGRPLSIDPGEHAFVFEQSGQAPVEKRLVLREGDRDRREEVVIGPPAPAAPAGPPATPPSTTPGWWTTQRTLAVVGGGLGLVGVGLGAGWAGFAASAQSQEKSNCSTSSCPNSKQATVDYDTAREDATASTVAFIAGGAFLAAGAVLWLTAPSVHVAPAVGTRSAGLTVIGEF